MADQLDRLTAALADRYATKRVLGTGGMASAYLAEDLKHRLRCPIPPCKLQEVTRRGLPSNRPLGRSE